MAIFLFMTIIETNIYSRLHHFDIFLFNFIIFLEYYSLKLFDSAKSLISNTSPQLTHCLCNIMSAKDCLKKKMELKLWSPLKAHAVQYL